MDTRSASHQKYMDSTNRSPSPLSDDISEFPDRVSTRSSLPVSEIEHTLSPIAAALQETKPCTSCKKPFPASKPYKQCDNCRASGRMAQRLRAERKKAERNGVPFEREALMEKLANEASTSHIPKTGGEEMLARLKARQDRVVGSKRKFGGESDSAARKRRMMEVHEPEVFQSGTALYASLQDALKPPRSGMATPPVNFYGSYSIVSDPTVNHSQRIMLVARDLKRRAGLTFTKTPILNRTRGGDTVQSERYPCACGANPPGTKAESTSTTTTRSASASVSASLKSGLFVTTPLPSPSGRRDLSTFFARKPSKLAQSATPDDIEDVDEPQSISTRGSSRIANGHANPAKGNGHTATPTPSVALVNGIEAMEVDEAPKEKEEEEEGVLNHKAEEEEEGVLNHKAEEEEEGGSTTKMEVDDAVTPKAEQDAPTPKADDVSMLTAEPLVETTTTTPDEPVQPTRPGLVDALEDASEYLERPLDVYRPPPHIASGSRCGGTIEIRVEEDISHSLDVMGQKISVILLHGHHSR